MNVDDSTHKKYIDVAAKAWQDATDTYYAAILEAYLGGPPPKLMRRQRLKLWLSNIRDWLGDFPRY